MRQMLFNLRTRYFEEITKLVEPFSGQCILLTHLLEDRPELIEAINKIAPIALVIAIPYSTNQDVFDLLQQKYTVITPTLDQLYDAHYLKNLTAEYLLPASPTIIIEIGGYFAKVLKHFNSSGLENRLVGIIEDTEVGHKEYEKIADKLHCPIVSIARSPLKANEDFLVGHSCLYSTERLLRKLGFLIDGSSSLVLGYGKVGKGLAYSLTQRHCPVMVYDIQPDRRINALSEGFRIPTRECAIKTAGIIYGAAGACSLMGDDFNNLRNGVLLVSCSSKKIEFDIAGLEQRYVKTQIFEHLDKYEKDGKTIYLANGGAPINFLDGATIGPILALTHGEIIFAIQDILELSKSKKYGLFQTSETTRMILAEKWLNYFCTPEGHYKHA